MNAADRYDSLFQYYADMHTVDWMLMKAQAKVESSFNPHATSPVGAQGLAQFMPATWAEWGDGDPFNPEAAIKAQCAYMAWLAERHNGMREVLAAYNAGTGRIARNPAPADWPLETRGYVDKVVRAFERLKKGAPR